MLGRYWCGDREGNACEVATGWNLRRRGGAVGSLMLCVVRHKREGRRAWKDIGGLGARGQMKNVGFAGSYGSGLCGQGVVLSGQPRAGRIYDGQLGLDAGKATLAVACGMNEFV